MTLLDHVNGTIITDSTLITEERKEDGTGIKTAA